MASVADFEPAGMGVQAPRRARSAPAHAAPRRDSAAAMVRRALRAEIINMARKPGEPISEKGIAATFGVSRTPVREALLALSEEGLVDIFPQSGTFVARIPLAGLPEAILIRMSLEDTIVRMATEAAEADDIAALRRDIAQQRDAAQSGDLMAFHQLDEAFHAHIAAIAGYPGVWTLVQQVKFQMDRFRHLTLPMANRPGSIADEHAAIVEAIESRNPASASAAMALHLSTMRTGLGLARTSNPDFFLDDAAPTARERP